MTLQEIKKYYGDRCKAFTKIPWQNNEVPKSAEEILFKIGLPDHEGYGGDYIILPALKTIDNKYLQFATREDEEEEFKLCVDLDTGEVVFNLDYDGDDVTYTFLNSDLESYLKYIYTYERFMKEVVESEKFGDYDQRHAKYAKELEKQFAKINKDVEKEEGWGDLIEEMNLGVL